MKKSFFLFLMYWVLTIHSVAESKESFFEIGPVSISQKTVCHFKKISEFFDGKENTNGVILLRTDNHNRAGVYFETTLSRHSDSIPMGAYLELMYVSAHNPSYKKYIFPISNSSKWVLYMGLTDKECQVNEPKDIVAWCISLKNKDGSVLAQKKSFLWSKG